MILRRTWAAVALAVAGACVPAACSTSSSSANTTTTTAPVGTIEPTPTTKASAPSPDLNQGLPPAPQATPTDAAGAFMLGWENGNRPYSASVATTAAVTTLFAQRYGGQTLVSRGCTTMFPPYTCSYGPNGGASSSLQIYEVVLGMTSGGRWYVTAVNIEGG